MNELPDNESYFPLSGAVVLSDVQRDIVKRFRAVITALAPLYLKAADTKTRADDDGALTLLMYHSQDPGIRIEWCVDRHGRIDLTSQIFHPAFSVCFNDKWEPADCLGGIGCAIAVLRGLVEGRVYSRILWSGSLIAATTDVLEKEDGTSIILDREYHLAGVVGALFARRRTISRVDFTEPARRPGDRRD